MAIIKYNRHIFLVYCTYLYVKIFLIHDSRIANKDGPSMEEKEKDIAKDIAKDAVEVLVESANIFLGKKFDPEKIAKGINFILTRVKKPVSGGLEPKTDLKKVEEDVKLFWIEKNKSLEKIYGKGNIWTNRG